MRKQSQEAKYYVYIWYIVSPFEIFYVGKGSGNRATQLKGRNKFFMDMYNTHECKPMIVVDGLTEETAFDMERIVIEHIRTHYPQYRLTNICDGGEGASGWIATPEYRENMRQKNLGEGNPNYHNWWPEERKVALSRKLKESGDRKGERNSRAKPIMCVETGIIYPYIAEALRACHIKDHSNMSAALKSPRRTAGGYHWVVGSMIEKLTTPEARQEYLETHRKKPWNKKS